MIDRSDEHAADSCRRRYWSSNLKLIALLLPIWALVTFGIGYFARELDFRVLGWPFSFWVGAQGALVVYVALVACYAKAMNRLDRQADAAMANASRTPEAVASPCGSWSAEQTGRSDSFLQDRS